MRLPLVRAIGRRLLASIPQVQFADPAALGDALADAEVASLRHPVASLGVGALRVADLARQLAGSAGQALREISASSR